MCQICWYQINKENSEFKKVKIKKYETQNFKINNLKD